MEMKNRKPVTRRYLVRVPKGLGYKEVQREGVNTTKAVVAEFIGTILLVLIWTATTMSLSSPTFLSKVAVSLSVGFIVSTMLVVTEHASGGNLNPCITLAFLLTDKLKPVRALLFVVVQCIGAIVGSGILKGISPDLANEELNFNSTVTIPDEDITAIQAAGIEFLSCLVMVLTALAVRDENRKDLKGSGPLSVGLAMAACHLAFTTYTRPSMNPARSLGPAVITGIWRDHWVYWVGPMLGSLMAAFLYAFVYGAADPDTEERVEEIMEENSFQPRADVVPVTVVEDSVDTLDTVEIVVPVESGVPLQSTDGVEVRVDTVAVDEHLPPELGPNEREIK